MTKDDTNKRRLARIQTAQQQKQEALDEQQDRLDSEWTEEDWYAKLLPNLSAATNETVLQAIQRYGALMKQKRPKQPNDKDDTDDDNARQLAQDSFNDVTEAANALLRQGKMDIYQTRQTEIAAALETIRQQQQQSKQPKLLLLVQQQQLLLPLPLPQQCCGNTRGARTGRFTVRIPRRTCSTGFGPATLWDRRRSGCA